MWVPLPGAQVRNLENAGPHRPTGYSIGISASRKGEQALECVNGPPGRGIVDFVGKGGGSRFRVDKFDISRRISAMAQRTAALDPPCWKAPSGSLRPSDASRMAKNTTRSCGTGAT